MTRLAQKQLTLIINIVLVLMTIAGCEEQNKSQAQSNVDVRQARLLVSENIQLQKQLTALKDEFKNRDAELAKSNAELTQQKQLAEECLKQQETFNQAEMEKELNGMADPILAATIDENVSLSQENEKLKEQVAKLQKELEEAKK